MKNATIDQSRTQLNSGQILVVLNAVKQLTDSRDLSLHNEGSFNDTPAPEILLVNGNNHALDEQLASDDPEIIKLVFKPF